MPIIELACSIAFVATAFLGTSLADRRTARRRLKNRRRALPAFESPEIITPTVTETRPAELGPPVPLENALAQSVVRHLNDQAQPPEFYIPCPGAGSWRKRHPSTRIPLDVDEETAIIQELSTTLPLAESTPIIRSPKVNDTDSPGSSSPGIMALASSTFI